MTSEWGIPDWHDAKSYGDTKYWDYFRWRWEFRRRRQDVREYFLSKIYGLDFRNLNPVPGVQEPAEVWVDDPTDRDRLGYQILPNPRTGEHKDLETHVWMTDGFVKIWYADNADIINHAKPNVLMAIGKNEIAIGFDLKRPIRPQIIKVQTLLQTEQENRFGKIFKYKSHKQKWLTYLRVLDARELSVSWSKIGKHLNFTAGSPQSARDTWEQAVALRSEI